MLFLEVCTINLMRIKAFCNLYKKFIALFYAAAHAFYATTYAFQSRRDRTVFNIQLIEILASFFPERICFASKSVLKPFEILIGFFPEGVGFFSKCRFKPSEIA